MKQGLHKVINNKKPMLLRTLAFYYKLNEFLVTH